MAGRRYDEDEVALILRTAANPSAAAPAAHGTGLTLAQIQDIASEVGIDPHAVERAAHALALRDAPPASPVLGGPVAPQYEQMVDVAVRSADYPDLVLAIRRAMGRQGIVSTELGALEWRARDAGGGRYVSVRPMGERTLVRVLGNLRDSAFLLFVGSGSLGGALTAAALKALGLAAMLGVGMFPVIVLGAYLPGRFLFRWRSRREDERLRATLAAVTRALQERGPDRAGDVFDRDALPPAG